MVAGLHRGTQQTATPHSASAFGILYAEDFDNPTEHDNGISDQPEPELPAAVITQADVDAACATAVRAAKLEWQHGDEQMRVKALSSLGQTLANARMEAERSANTIAEATVSTILSIVTGLLPQFSREHGAAEVRALLGRVLPTIRSQTRVNVRVHSDLVATIQRDVTELEPDIATMIDITSAPLERGDVKVSWENGSMTRDTRKMLQTVEDILAQLGLQQSPAEASLKRRMAYAD